MAISLFDWSSINFQKKILITHDVKNVSRLKRIENRKGHDIVNIFGRTPADLAKEVMLEAQAKKGVTAGIELIRPEEGAVYINKLLAKDEYTLVPKESSCITTGMEVLRILNILRQGEVTDLFRTGDGKTAQIRSLLSDYEEMLTVRNLYDTPRLLKEACAILADDRKEQKESSYHGFLYGIFNYESDRLTMLERKFIGLLSSGKLEQISTCANTDKTTVDYSFYRIYGRSNEPGTVVSVIKDKGYKFGDVNIFYSSAAYETLIRSSLEEAGIPYAFVTGKSVQDQGTFSLLASIFDWADGGYRYKDFRPVVNNDLIRLDRDYEFGNRVGIGWGIDRYRDFVRHMTDEKENYIV